MPADARSCNLPEGLILRDRAWSKRRRRLLLLELPLRPLEMLKHMFCKPLLPTLCLGPMAPRRRGVLEAAYCEFDAEEERFFWAIEWHPGIPEQNTNKIQINVNRKPWLR
jgi:hypothetical protein